MNVGLRLTELRKQRGLTTNKLANLSGLSQSFIRSVELNEKGITVESLQLLCDTLQLSLHDFFEVPDAAADTMERELQVCISSLTAEQKQALLILLKR